MGMGFASMSASATKTALYECKFYYSYKNEFLLLEILRAKIRRINNSIEERKAIADIAVAYLLLGEEAKHFEFSAFEAIAQIERRRESFGAEEIALLTRWGCKAATVAPNFVSIRNGAKKAIWVIEIDNPQARGCCAKLQDYFGKERIVAINRQF